MFSKVKSCAVHGVDGRMIDVEADVNDGLPVFTMVGYLSSSVRESSERVRTALKNSGFHLPPKRITINLSPADMRKDGSGYDLAIATAVLLSLGVTAELPMEQTLVLGELSLDGSIKAIPGVLPMVICAREEGMTSCIVPKENVQEAALVHASRLSISAFTFGFCFGAGNIGYRCFKPEGDHGIYSGNKRI